MGHMLMKIENLMIVSALGFFQEFLGADAPSSTAQLQCIGVLLCDLRIQKVGAYGNSRFVVFSVIWISWSGRLRETSVIA